jgi:hypothetical protein
MSQIKQTIFHSKKAEKYKQNKSPCMQVGEKLEEQHWVHEHWQQSSLLREIKRRLDLHTYLRKTYNNVVNIKRVCVDVRDVACLWNGKVNET